MSTKLEPTGISCDRQTPRERFSQLVEQRGAAPLFICGDALSVLANLPAEYIDCAMTSPPYWGHRDYGGGGIGLEKSWQDYVSDLTAICAEVRRVLKPTGSF